METQAEGAAAGGPSMAAGCLALLRQPAVHYGARLAETVRHLAIGRGCERILPVVTGSLRGHPAIAAGLAALGSAALPVFHGVKPHTPFDAVLALAAEVRRTDPDLILVVGGGSALDAAKIAGLAVANGAAANGAVGRDDLLRLRAVPGDDGELAPSPVDRGIPILAVPTTLSAAEFGMIGGATDPATGIKHLFKSDRLAPDIVVFDPWLAAGTPRTLWLSTGVRSLDHGIETILSPDANPFTDALALRGLALLGEGLRRCAEREGDVEARHACQLGAWLAGCAIGRIRYGASHGLGHQLGAVAGVPHGMTSCVLLPAVLAYNAPVSSERQALIAEALGCPGQPAADAVRGLVAALGLPTGLRALEVPDALLPRVAESALDNPFVRANPRPVRFVADALAILHAAL